MNTKANRSRRALLLASALSLPAIAAGGILTALPSGEGLASAPAAHGVRLYRLLLAIAAIVGLCQVLGGAVRRVGQPPVIGEITAGLLLGPTVLGAAAPDAQRWLFPADVVPALSVLGQIGVVLFVFMVGQEASFTSVRRNGGVALVLGWVNVVFPLACGALLALSLLRRYAPHGTPSRAYVAFVALCFAVTAFPVLARILTDHRLAATPVGVLGLAVSGMGDAALWGLLGVVVALATKGSTAGALLAIAGVLAVTALALVAGRPLLAAALARLERRDGDAAPAVAALLLGVICVTAAATDALGFHAVFGAFIAGLLVPRTKCVAEFAGAIEGVTMRLLVPIFFATVGLQFRLGDLSSAADWLICLAVIAVAVGGKMLAVTLTARGLGATRRFALALGGMMSCRGLTEIVVLQLGLQLGIISARLFAILIVMTLVTTAMTGPFLRLLRLDAASPHIRFEPEEAAPKALADRNYDPLRTG